MKGHWIEYSKAEMRFLEAKRLLPISEYHAAFVARFGRDDVSAINLHSLRKRKGWKTGRTGCFVKGQEAHNKGKPHPAARQPNCARNQFKKGQTPHNTNYLHHERVTKDGYIEISVDETNPYTGFERRYVLKHRWLWEKANGPVPKGHGLKCLDSNKLNTDPSNWEALPRAVLARLNSGRWGTQIAYDDAPAELKPAIMAMAKLKNKIQERVSVRIQDGNS